MTAYGSAAGKLRAVRRSPGATLGILGGGQLGRMLALAARPLGYRVAVLDPDVNCAARPVVEQCLTARFDDDHAAALLGQASDVVTLEIEKISLSAIAATNAHAPVRPGANVLAVVQNRAEQKSWLERHGCPVGPWRLAQSPSELAAAVAEFGSVFAKACHGGYDGRGQMELTAADAATAAFRELGGGPCAVEKALKVTTEISVLVARRPGGEIVVYPPALNHHENRILACSVLPADLPHGLPRSLLSRAQELARTIAEATELEGLLVVEMFITDNADLLVNELAPRPHNSYHASTTACATGQFEQAVRAAFDLPLGGADIIRPTAIRNLLGDLWTNGEPDFTQALGVSCTTVNLYGKAQARPGRKMGHLLATGATASEAMTRVNEAYERLRHVH